MTDVDFLWNIAQHEQLRSLDRQASVASETARRPAAELIDVRVALERLSLTCRAMWELLREGTSVTEADLISRVHEIDLRDHHGDGRAHAAPKHCPRCSRVNNARREKCLYCASELGTDSAFDSI